MKHARVVVMCLFVAMAAWAWADAAWEEVVIYGDASDKPSVPPYFSPDEVAVAVDSVVFFRLKTSAAGYKLSERARIVDMRITEVLCRRLVGPVTIRPIRGKPTIYVGPVRVVTVYPEDAKAAGMDCPWQLARQWADGLRQGLPVVVPGPLPQKAGGVGGGAEAVTVAIDNRVLFRLRWPNGFSSLQERQATVERRVTDALSRRASQVTTAATESGIGVYADGRLVVEATAMDAQIAGCSAEALAAAWAKNLSAALKLIAGGKGQ